MREAFRAHGHDAWSCDILPVADGSAHHLQCDVAELLDQPVKILRHSWQVLIAHPPCTYLTNSAAWAFSDGPYHQRVKPETLVGSARRQAREEAIAFVKMFWNSGIERIAIENPVGALSKHFRKWSQIIQPYQFGDDASKATCLWLNNLPPLVPTKHVAPRMVNGKPRWANQTDSGQNKLSPSDDRGALRSITYQGIAEAMAAQWGDLP